MYEFFEGELFSKSPSRIVLNVGGIAYSIAIPLSTFSKLSARGNVRVLIHLHQNEEGPRLFGFAEERERELFRLLLSVGGVGPSTAIQLLSQLTPAELVAAVSAEDVTRLRTVKGVGEKTAKRILIELKEKIVKLGIEVDRATIYPPVIQDAVSALLSIGFERKDAEAAVIRAQKKLGSDNFQELVKAAIADSR